MCNDCYDKVIGRIKAELEDIETYRELENSTEDEFLKCVVSHIVKDEESHARYLAQALKRRGKQMPEELWKEYFEMEDSFRN